MRGRLYPCMFNHLACEVFLCGNSANWWVGDPEGPYSATFRLCDSCAKSMAANFPQEVVPEEQKALMWQETEAPVVKRSKRKSGDNDE